MTIFSIFFDEIGFTDNPSWASCYCHFYHFDGSRKNWSKRTKEQNRKASKELIISGKMKGFLAYFNNKPIGWCNANSKNNYSHIPYKADIDLKKKVGTIVCFLISPSYRKKGVARLLLKETCDYYENKKYDYLESYPTKELQSDAHNYHGPFRLYLSEGFTIYDELDRIYVMRKYL